MRSRHRFIMHPLDESAFAELILSDEDVRIVDGPIWKNERPRAFQSINDIKGTYCIIWSRRDRPTLTARYKPDGNEWYCDSEMATVQFLRSEVRGTTLTEGAIAIATNPVSSAEAHGVEKRYRALRHFIKSHYTNSVLRWYDPNAPIAPAAPGRSANPSAPDPQVWVSPSVRPWLAEDPRRTIRQHWSYGNLGRLNC